MVEESSKDMQDNQEIQGQSIPFIQVEQDESTGKHEYSISTEAMTVLGQMQKKQIVVIAMVGPERTGKSFLCNRLLGNNTGFQIGDSVQSCTRGVTMWSQPIYLSEDVDAIVLDFEGLNNQDREFTASVKLFALAIMLSSQLVYNQKGHITDDTIKELGIVQLMKSEMKIRESQHEELGLEFAHYFPKLTLVLRDYTLKFRTLTALTYLNQSLDPQRGLSKEETQLNNERRCIKEFFSELDCQILPCPLEDEDQVAYLDVKQDSDLKQDFKDKSNKLFEKLKDQSKVKAIDGKPLTGVMLLNLAMELVESLNREEVPSLVTCFGRVVAIESQRISEQLFQEIIARINQNCDENLMPFENETLDDIQEEIVEFSNSKISEKLGQILNTKHLIDISQDFEHRIKKYFKLLRKNNMEKSKSKCLNLIQELQKEVLTKIQIDDIEDIKPGMMSQIKSEYSELLQKYLQQTSREEPYRSQAIMDFFQTDVIEDLGKLVKDIEDGYTISLNKSQLVLQDYQRHEEQLKAILTSQNDQLDRLDQQQQQNIAEKTQLELQTEELNRQMKETLHQKQKVSDIGAIDLNNLRNNQERELQEKNNKIKQLYYEIEEIKDQIQQNKEQISQIQNQKLKEVSSLKNELQIMQGTLEDDKKKLHNNSEFMTINKMFKEAQQGLKQVKQQVTELQEVEKIRMQQKEIQIDQSEKQYRMDTQVSRIRELYENDQEKLQLKQKKELQELEKEYEKLIADKEATEDSIFVLENESDTQQSKEDNLKNQNKLLHESIKLSEKRMQHQESLIRTLRLKIDSEQKAKEDLEVQFYNQSINQATSCEDTDNLVTFIEEFIRKLTGNSKAEDSYQFKVMNQADQKTVNEILSQFQISYGF